MLNRIRKLREEESGFTLIELLIVIVILGILAAIVVFAIGSTRGDAVQNACKNAFKQVELSAEAVKTKGGAYLAPSTATGASDLTQAGVNIKYSPLLAGTTPATGGLLKEYPFSKDYALVYSTSGSPAIYTITVSKRTSTGAIDATALANNTSKEGCDALS